MNSSRKVETVLRSREQLSEVSSSSRNSHEVFERFKQLSEALDNSRKSLTVLGFSNSFWQSQTVFALLRIQWIFSVILKTSNKSVLKHKQSEGTGLISDSDKEFADDEQDVKKMGVSEVLDSLDVVKCCAEIHGDKQMNIMLNKLIEKVGTIKLQNYLYVF